MHSSKGFCSPWTLRTWWNNTDNIGFDFTHILRHCWVLKCSNWSLFIFHPLSIALITYSVLGTCTLWPHSSCQATSRTFTCIFTLDAKFESSPIANPRFSGWIWLHHPPNFSKKLSELGLSTARGKHIEFCAVWMLCFHAVASHCPTLRSIDTRYTSPTCVCWRTADKAAEP